MDATLRAAIAVHKFVRNKFGQRSWPRRGKLQERSLQIGPPADFMFQLTREEFDHLRSQSVTSSWGGRRYPPYAFTEQGVAMLSGVLKSTRAINVNIEIMRAFVRLRQMLASNKKLAQKIDELEQKYDDQFKMVFEAIKQLMAPSTNEKKQFEPPRICRRLHFLRGWSNEQSQTLSPGDPGTGRAPCP